MRARINDRFTQLHAERTEAEAKLTALASHQPKAADPAILDEVPYAGDILPALPPALKARLFAAFDLTILWNKDDGQATVTVTITDDTLTALPEILDPDQPGYHDTAAAPQTMWVLAQPPITGSLSQPSAGGSGGEVPLLAGVVELGPLADDGAVRRFAVKALPVRMPLPTLLIV